MSARQKMTMRAVLQRNQSAKDPYGQKGLANWKTIDSNFPCFVWEAQDRIVYGTATVEIGTPMMIAPLGTDITVDDMIDAVCDRLGEQLFGRMKIDGVMRRRDHKEMRLKRAS